jgi:MoaA/NifB/PqqE/SkfB family radical SAM enzyme
MKFGYKLKSFLKRIIPNKIMLLYKYFYFKLLPFIQFCRWQKRYLLKLKKAISLDYFEVNLTEHCNLNCKSCQAFAPLAKETYLAVTSFERDMTRISEITSENVNRIFLLGGEPLLHPHITTLFDIARKYFKNATIGVITNGLLLLKQPDNFWKSLQENNIKIILSKYPINIDIRKIKQLVTQYNIALEFWEIQVKHWSHFSFDLKGKKNYKLNWLFCEKPRACTTLKDGKLYTCSLIPVVNIFNTYFNKELSVLKNDYVDIYQIKSVDEIINYLNRPVPFCKYCNLKGWYHINWETSKKDISEWV